MTLISMTGFGRAEGTAQGVAWAWEARSVNSRTLDVRVRTPPGHDGLEARAREEAARRFKRGSIQLSLTLRRDVAEAPALSVNPAAVERLLAAGAPYVAAGRVRAPDWAALLQVRGVLDYADAEGEEAARAAREAALAAGLAQALDALALARAGEGAALGGVLSATLARIEALTQGAREAARVQPEALRDRFRARLAELLDGAAPEDRVLQEAAVLALKADVREELDRLTAHVAAARALIADGEGAGRKLDFLAQEFLREANTLGAKAGVLALTRLSLDLKAAIDQLKEQAANVE